LVEIQSVSTDTANLHKTPAIYLTR
jgi:hypothetical protein